MEKFDATITNYNHLNGVELGKALHAYPTGRIGNDGNKKDLIMSLCNADIKRAKERLEELKKIEEEDADWLAIDETYTRVFQGWVKEANDMIEAMEDAKKECDANKKLYYM